MAVRHTAKNDKLLVKVERRLLEHCERLLKEDLEADDLRKIHAIYKQMVGSKKNDDGHDDEIVDLDLPFG